MACKKLQQRCQINSPGRGSKAWRCFPSAHSKLGTQFLPSDVPPLSFSATLLISLPSIYFYLSSSPDVSQVPSCISSGSIRLHASNPNLSTAALGNEKAYAEPLDSPIDVAKLQEDFCRVASNCESLKRHSELAIFIGVGLILIGCDSHVFDCLPGFPGELSSVKVLSLRSTVFMPVCPVCLICK